MHYTGMAAMEMDAALRYVPSIFFLSIGVAIAASCLGLWLAFTLARYNHPDRFLYKSGAAFIIGGAICGMHYTGMMAAVFYSLPADPDRL
jgi:diguanylate cyclase